MTEIERLSEIAELNPDNLSELRDFDPGQVEKFSWQYYLPFEIKIYWPQLCATSRLVAYICARDLEDRDDPMAYL